MESTGVPGRIHISGFTACYLAEHRGVTLEEGAIKSEVEDQKARPVGDYEKLLDDLRERYNESRENASANAENSAIFNKIFAQLFGLQNNIHQSCMKKSLKKTILFNCYFLDNSKNFLIFTKIWCILLNFLGFTKIL